MWLWLVAGICGMGELLLETELDEEQEEYASFSHANARSMLHIVNDVLDFSKVESNKVRPRLGCGSQVSVRS